MIEAQTISERYRENLSRERHILIPELVTCLLEHNEFEQIFGYNHYNKYNISKQIYKYFYTSKFIGNILEKPSIAKMLSLWRLSISASSKIVPMEYMSYKPHFVMVSPQGQSNMPRDMFDAGRKFKSECLDHRMNQFTQFTKWAVFCSEDLTNEVLAILEEVTKCGNHFKYFTTPPECFFVEKD